MIRRKELNRAIKRFTLILLFSLLIAFVGSEVVYPLVRSDNDRPPQTVEIIIPAGTAEKVARGESLEAIPNEMAFVVGDILLVKNEDTVLHKLGEMSIAPGGSVSLPLEKANIYEYTATFHPNRYLEFTVREGLTLNIRLIALGSVAPATAMFIFFYSLVIYPLNPAVKASKKETPA